MKRRWIPFLATTAALALAAVAPAQDRGRRSDGGSRLERSSPSRSGGGPSRPQGESRPSRDTSRPSRDESRPSPSRDQSRPSQDSTRPTRDSSNPWSRDSSRDGRPSQDNTRPSRDNTNPSRDTTRPSRDESRPSNNRPSQDNTRPSRDSNRTSPFDRSTRDRSNGDSRQGSTGSRNDRPNPFDRNNRDDRNSGSRDNRGSNDRNDNRGGNWNRDSSPSRNYSRPPSQYDGRGRVEARHYGAPPSRNSLSFQVRRTDIRRGGSSFAFGAEFGGLRIGYVSYGNGYRRSSFGIGFGYSHYAYDPYAFGVACVASPWYRYSYLPPYIDNTRVIVVNNYPASWNYDGWRDYDYRNDRQNEAIRDALDDLQNAFEKQDERDANQLVPQNGNVAIFNDGKYDYSLNPEDFQQMFLDGVEQSKTIRYEILDSRTRGDEVRVRARHEYEDSWGAKQSVVHTLTLRREGGDYVIREFGSE